MRSLAPIVACVLIFITLGRAGQQTPPDLKSKADAAQGSERIGLSLDYAHHELEHANTLYTEGDIEKAETAMSEVMTYSQRAADTAMQTNKRLKQTEIDLRKLQHRMHDIGQSLNIDDRPPVEKAVQQMEQLRANLLAKMFGEKAEPKERSQ